MRGCGWLIAIIRGKEQERPVGNGRGGKQTQATHIVWGLGLAWRVTGIG